MAVKSEKVVKWLNAVRKLNEWKSLEKKLREEVKVEAMGSATLPEGTTTVELDKGKLVFKQDYNRKVADDMPLEFATGKFSDVVAIKYGLKLKDYRNMDDLLRVELQEFITTKPRLIQIDYKP